MESAFPTMDTKAIEQQASEVKDKRDRAKEDKQNKEDAFKDYLSVVVPKDAEEKTLVIRLLPAYAGASTPFELVHAHMVRVAPGAYEGKSWKRFMCAYEDNKETKTIDDCPFCATAREAFKSMKEATSESEKERFKEIGKANMPQEMWVVRCIERGNEEEGVKFWRFNHQFGGDGIYDKIMDLQKDKAEKDPNYSIFDLNNGCDLKIRIKRNDQGKYVYRVTLENENTPLTTDVAKGMEWINNTKTWRDVFKVRSYDEMAIVVKGGIPVWDKDQKCFIEKNEYDAKRAAQQTAQDVEDKSYQQLQQGTYAAQPAHAQPAAAPVAAAQPAAFPSMAAPQADPREQFNDLPF